MGFQRYRRADGSTVYLSSFFDPEGNRRREKIREVPPGATKAEHEKARTAALNHAAAQRCHVANGEWKPPAAGEAKKKALTLGDLVETFNQTYRTRGGTDYFVHRLKPLVAFFGIEKPAQALTRADLETFRDERLKTASPSTVRKDLAATFTLFKWSGERGLTEGNPAEKVRKPAEPPHRTATLSAAEEKALLEAAPPWVARIIRFCMNTGADRADVLRVSWADLDETAGTVWLPRGKTGSERVCYVNETLAAVLGECRKTRTFGDAGRIFLGPKGRALTLQILVDGVRGCYRRAGLDERQPFRRFRHSFGTRLAEQGANEFTIARLLGHKTTEETRKYVNLAAAHLRAAVARLDGPPGAEVAMIVPKATAAGSEAPAR